LSKYKIRKRERSLSVHGQFLPLEHDKPALEAAMDKIAALTA
jgi:hypothetical protein